MKKYLPVLLCVLLMGCEQSVTEPKSPAIEKKPVEVEARAEKIAFDDFAVEMYYDDYTKDNWPKLHNLIGAAGIERLKSLDRQAIKYAYTDPACNKFKTNGVSMERTTKDEIVVFIDCGNPSNEWQPYRVYVSESDIKAWKTSHPE